MYQFTDDCLIGVDQIDNEHRRLFELVNEVANLLMRDDINRSDVNTILMELDEYAVLHFKHEEDYMKEINLTFIIIFCIVFTFIGRSSIKNNAL